MSPAAPGRLFGLGLASPPQGSLGKSDRGPAYCGGLRSLGPLLPGDHPSSLRNADRPSTRVSRACGLDTCSQAEKPRGTLLGRHPQEARSFLHLHRPAPLASGQCQEAKGSPTGPEGPQCSQHCKHTSLTDRRAGPALPSSGVHIFASQLHTHLTGRKVVTVLVRDGRETEIVNRDNHYSPHFQEIRMLKKVVSVHQGGFGILEEMCVNYVHYYPQTHLELCKSAVDPGFLQKYFHLLVQARDKPTASVEGPGHWAGEQVARGHQRASPASCGLPVISRTVPARFNSEDVCTCPQATVQQQFASVPWNSFSRDVLRALYAFAPISMHCNRSSAVRFQGEWDLQPLPKIVSTLEEPTPHCPTRGTQSPAGPTVVNIGRGKA
ncbi:Hypothetical predicted protein [Marmota monax]|uniref:Copper type II ascorbate-dependent monooxygenase C-terminal domain-containing protein n=1 Tax=Marmota monax TaxID=9995 RepID=A0A5E4AAM6_MARMO|nr:Hypothetical predicted protein [Marmota monax]